MSMIGGISCAVCVVHAFSQRVEAALATAWGGSGPAPLRPTPPSLFVASDSAAAGRVSPSKCERERPFGFVRDELARFSLESKGSSSSRQSSRGGGAGVKVRSLKGAAQDRRQQSHLQLCSSSSSSSSSSHHSDDSEDSLQADACATVVHRGIRSMSGSSSNDAAPAHGSDSEVQAQAPPSDSSSVAANTSPCLKPSPASLQVDRIDSALEQYHQRYH
jgi:hypothetical protein